MITIIIAHETFIGVLNINFYNRTVSFKVISGVGEEGCFPQIRVLSGGSAAFLVQIYHAYSSYKNCRVLLIYNPNAYSGNMEVFFGGNIPNSGLPTSIMGAAIDIRFNMSYNELRDKPTIPEAITVDSALSETSENPVQNKVMAAALADKQDLLTKEPILNNDIDWNTLVETAAYPVGLDWLSEDNTHGLGGIYGFGFLTILARRNYNGWVYQIYINDHKEVYMRTFYRNWSLWERIDAGRPATASQIGGVKSGGDISVAANGTVSVSKSITITPSSPVTMKEFKQLIFSTIKQNGYGRTYIFKTDMSVITSHWDDDDAVIAFFGNTLTAMPLAIVVNYITLLLSSTGAEAVYIVKTITDSDEPQWSELKTIIN